MATSISKTSVAVGMDASAFKTGAESLKGYFKDIGATAGKLVGVLGLASLSFAGIKAGIEGSLGKVVAFEKTQAILEAIGKTAGSSKESIANLVSTLSAITGRNDEAGKLLGDMARKMMSIGFSAAESEKLVTSFYKTAKAVPGEIGQTVGMLEKMALNLDELGFVEFGQYKALAEMGIPIMEVMAAKLSELRGVVVTAEEVAAQLKLAQATGGASGVTTQEQLQVMAGLGDSELVQAQAEAVGNTFAGAMGKAKGEISLMFFEIGKAINAFFGGTKTYVSIFKTITAGVKLAREQVELLAGVFANNRQWIDDFKNGIDILVVAFFRGFEVMGEQLTESKRLIGEWFNTWKNNNAVSSKLDEAAGKTNILTELFKGFGEYMEDFASNFEAIFEVWNVILDSFGDRVSNVTNIWEGMYEILQTIKTAAQVGFLAIGEIGINAINGILKVFEDMAAFTQKWIDKFSYGLGNIAEALGIVAKGTTDTMMAQDRARGNVTFNLGRISTNGMAEGRAAIQAQAEEERRARIKMYNERKLALDKDKPKPGEDPTFGRGKGGAGGAGAQLAAPTLLSAGGAEEYKLIVERNNAKLMDGAKRTNDLLEQANGHLETIAGNRPIAPAMTVVPMIPRG
jgi:hypothetical protein